ncbi:hypothetical protein [Clostridium botulinum]|uniref:hypothetical protein n=1 Tax=Clostridium botulinum TaxID=1491 RepID=UPI001C9B5A89|nr:hypothetical protein [Clostridium botulinum]MBY6860825.1 hypothetical protein [Clostridium botulinum]MBY7043865.1 hypothetical protein [Clostridium botulinum]
MLYSVSEISNLINLSKVSIYKKLKLKEIEPHLTKLQGVTYVNEVGFNLLKESLNLNEKIKTNLNNENINVEIATDLVDFKEDLTSLNLLKDDYIETLKKQIEEKDNQIQELHKLIENNQILLKQEKEVNLLQLEQHLKDVDLKLNDVKEKMEKRKQEKKKGFFKRIFK